MLELKVRCDCGQKFKFEVEPANNQMPYAIACPICGRDGTDKANQELSALTPVLSQTDAPPPPIAPLAAPASKLRINTGGHEPETAPPSAETATIENLVADSDPAPAPPRVKKPSFGKGLLGGLIGTVAGALVYFLILKFCGPQFRFVARYLAIGAGGLAGWLAELIGQGEGSKELGAITVVMVLGGLIGTQYLAALGWWHEKTVHFGAMNNSAYDVSVRTAQATVQAIPTGSDDEIRNFLASLYNKAGAHISPHDVHQQEVQDVRESLPGIRDLASGKITEDEFNATHGIDVTKEAKHQQEDFKSFFALWLISRSSLIALIGAAGLAYKLCTNA